MQEGFIQSRQYILRENGQKIYVRKTYGLAFSLHVCLQNQVSRGSGTMLGIEKVLGNHSSLSVSSGLICLLYIR